MPELPLPSRPSLELPVWAIRTLGGTMLALALALPTLAATVGWLQHERMHPLRTNGDDAIRPALIVLPGGSQPVEVAPFAMCETEVSLRQYELVTGERPNGCADGCDDDHPVHNVSWEDAAEYLNELTRLENRARARAGKPGLSLCYHDGIIPEWDRTCTGFRLPTEAEWEHAGRAGTQTAYSFGDAPEDICKYGNVATDQCDDGFERLAPVKANQLAPNPWGLHGMHGNAAEWVFDRYDRLDELVVRSLVERAQLEAIMQPQSARAQRDLAVALDGLGRLEAKAGKVSAARELLQRSVEISKALLEAEPDNAKIQRDLSLSLQALADLEAKNDNFSAAGEPSQEDPQNPLRPSDAWSLDLGPEAARVVEALAELDPDSISMSNLQDPLVAQLELAKRDLSLYLWAAATENRLSIHRGLRSGSFALGPEAAQSASRRTSEASSLIAGFRCARSLD